MSSTIESQAYQPQIPGVATGKAVGTAITILTLSSYEGQYLILQADHGRIYMAGANSTAACTVGTNSFYLAVDGSGPNTRDVYVTRDRWVMKLKGAAASLRLNVIPT